MWKKKKKKYTQKNISLTQKFVCILHNLPTGEESQILYIKIALFMGHTVNEADNGDFKWDQNKNILRLVIIGKQQHPVSGQFSWFL